MDAVLKHLGLRSDFIVCHPGVIDDPLSHARQPPPPAPAASIQNTHTHAHVLLLQALTPARHAALSAHLLRILSISHIRMDPGARD